VHIGGESLIYFGGVVGGREDARARYAPLAAGIAAALPALTGYVGIDVIDGDCARGPVVLDVNARLTTSYAGLRAALACNPAALVLDVIHNGRLPARAPHARRALRIAVDSHAA
jgi:tyramine---L-glutamate ligase